MRLFTLLLSLLGPCLIQAREALPAGMRFISGPVNSAVLERNGKSLAIYGVPPGSRHGAPDTLLLTTARRDVVWLAQYAATRGAMVVGPLKEADFLMHPEQFWSDLREKRFHDYAQQTTRWPVQPISLSRSVKGGDVLNWQGLSIRVLDTPGYTRGSISYLVELAGKKIAFTGDLIRGDGKLQDLFSLQDAIPEAKVGGYHGWAGRLGDLMQSLDRLADEKPNLLVPARGQVILDPQMAIERLQDRIRAVYANYLSIDALRWYFKDEHIRAKAQRVLGPDATVEWMPMAETLQLPKEIVAISNSRLILSADGSGFLVDCGGTGILDELRKLRSAGKLKSIDHVFVTHYHDDHTDALPKLVAEFGAKVHACGSLVDLLEHPGDYRLPCLTKNPTLVTAKHQDRDTWEWKEFRLKILDYPGQTLHHNALLVQQSGGWCALFVGDSFTPSGIDDYCLQNRNFLHEGQGFLRCLDQLGTLPNGTFLINQHVEPAFRFTPTQVSQMRETLRRRLPLLKELFAFDDPNYGLDDNWAFLHPYWIVARAGESAEVTLRVTNHSLEKRTFRVSFHSPKGWKLSASKSVRVAPRVDGIVRVNLRLPLDVSPGIHVLTADIAWDGGDLREWTEAVVKVLR